MSNQKSSAVGVANVLAILGIVLFGVLLYLGLSVKGGTMGVNILLSVGAMAVLALLLWFLIKAKSAQNKFSQWKVVEYITLAIYLIFSVVVAYNYILPFFYIFSNQDTYKAEAKADLDKCRHMVDDFEKFEAASMQVTISHMANAITEVNTRGSYKWDSVYHFMDSNNVTRDVNGLDNFSGGWTHKIAARAQKWNGDIAESDAIIESWNIMKLSSAIENIRNIRDKMPADLNIFSVEAPFKSFYQQDNIWLESDNVPVYDAPLTLTFPDSIQQAAGFSLLGLVALIIILALLLFNYFVAPRSSVIEVKGGDTGGAVL